MRILAPEPVQHAATDLPEQRRSHPRDLTSEPGCPGSPCPVPHVEDSLADEAAGKVSDHLAQVFSIGTALPALDPVALEAQRLALLAELLAERFRSAIPHVRLPDRRELSCAWSLETAARQARQVADAHLRRLGHDVPTHHTAHRSGGAR